MDNSRRTGPTCEETRRQVRRRPPRAGIMLHACRTLVPLAHHGNDTVGRVHRCCRQVESVPYVTVENGNDTVRNIEVQIETRAAYRKPRRRSKTHLLTRSYTVKHRHKRPSIHVGRGWPPRCAPAAHSVPHRCRSVAAESPVAAGDPLDPIAQALMDVFTPVVMKASATFLGLLLVADESTLLWWHTGGRACSRRAGLAATAHR